MYENNFFKILNFFNVLVIDVLENYLLNFFFLFIGVNYLFGFLYFCIDKINILIKNIV